MVDIHHPLVINLTSTWLYYKHKILLMKQEKDIIDLFAYLDR